LEPVQRDAEAVLCKPGAALFAEQSYEAQGSTVQSARKEALDAARWVEMPEAREPLMMQQGEVQQAEQLAPAV
jgi:hypothetical protein